jgi:hypothetical protein
MLFPTTLVGSYPQPEWLIDRAKLAGRFPPRVRARELWRIPPELLDEAQNDATLLAIRAQEDAGLDIITDDLPRRSKALILTIRAQRSIARVTPIPSHASSVRSAGVMPSRSTMSGSCARIRRS